ncbi:hypothetical protein ACQI4F_25080 [Mycolicibacterium vaccae]|uniref:hypothetical protein n=1 Tax=Mycolicibacterium vaccae TaxID=1810 RepID=UPI003CF87220
MPTVECRREIDVLPGDLPTVLHALCELSRRERQAGPTLRSGTVLRYTATLELFDVVTTGRVLAVWTAVLATPRQDPETVRRYREAAFADFLDELRREWSPPAEQAS